MYKKRPLAPNCWKKSKWVSETDRAHKDEIEDGKNVPDNANY